MKVISGLASETIMQTIKLSLAGVALLVAAGQAQAGVIGPTGPDTFGYSGNDIAYNLRDISSSGTFLLLSDDQMSGFLSFGFTFNFYGTDFNGIHVSSNGFLDFNGGSNGCCTGQPLPLDDSYEGGIIAGFWEDLDPGNGGAPAENNVRYQTLGSPGSREFVVGFYNVDHFSNGTNVTFEMILHEATNNIEFQYLSAASDGGTHSIGIERPDETDGLQVLRQSSGNPLPLERQGYLISSRSAIPEPGSLALLGLGMTGLIFVRRRKAVC